MTKYAVLVIIVFTTSIMIINIAYAQTQRREPSTNNAAAVQEAVAKVQATVRQLESEKSALISENDKLKKDTKRLKAEVASLNKKLTGIDNNLASSQQTLDRFQNANSVLAERLRDHQEKTRELIDKFKETVKNLQQVETERGQLQVTVADQKKDIEACISKNQSLHRTALDILNEYENKGVWDALLQREPITQVKKVEIENTAQNFKHNLEDQKIDNVSLSE